jgi:predicted regulator of Ras-like GTPase activity (Roadblock/LC7/MglB family)
MNELNSIQLRLMKPDGALLALAGDSKMEKIISALVANIWKDYENAEAYAFGGQNLQFMMMECEQGQVAVSKLHSMLLCMVAENSVQLGLLRGKMMSLLHQLQPLQKVYPVPEQ